MDAFKEINWSEVAREELRDRLTRFLIVKSISSKSKLSEKEAIDFAVELGRKIKKGRFEQLKKEGLV
jgi:hypothetical protein